MVRDTTLIQKAHAFYLNSDTGSQSDILAQ